MLLLLFRTLPAVGTGAASLGPATAAGTGVAPAAGTGAVTLAGATAAGTGVAPVVGTGAVTLAGATAAGAGTAPVTATGAVTLTGATVISVGVTVPERRPAWRVRVLTQARTRGTLDARRAYLLRWRTNQRVLL